MGDFHKGIFFFGSGCTLLSSYEMATSAMASFDNDSILILEFDVCCIFFIFLFLVSFSSLLALVFLQRDSTIKQTCLLQMLGEKEITYHITLAFQCILAFFSHHHLDMLSCIVGFASPGLLLTTLLFVSFRFVSCSSHSVPHRLHLPA